MRPSNPTLSYTQRLENRIKELEEQVEAYSKSPISTHPSSSHSSPPSFSSHETPSSSRIPDEHSMHRRFRGLKVDDRGSITYHGATSFFHLPAADHNLQNTGGNKFLPLTDAGSHRREQRRVNNIAWQQRPLENLSEIPVRNSFSQTRRQLLWS